MHARATRVRTLATTVLTLVTLALAGCNDGKGLRDEGPAHARPQAHAPAHERAQAHAHLHPDSDQNA
ncbi:hypothetical protein ACFS5L_40265 [Streptomyces phyllanthi]|uniref:hypothetical protein n=1 Tax=Streptomyces phyllanthi TaxID=1803180 RepID=UPI0031EC29B7